jgi:hypothetical protein
MKMALLIVYTILVYTDSESFYVRLVYTDLETFNVRLTYIISKCTELA